MQLADLTDNAINGGGLYYWGAFGIMLAMHRLELIRERKEQIILASRSIPVNSTVVIAK